MMLSGTIARLDRAGRICGLISLALVLVVAAGCLRRRVPETHYYTLDPTPGVVMERATGPALAVDELEVTAALRNDRIAYVAAPHHVGYYGYHLWVAEPDRLLTEYLRVALTAALPAAHETAAGGLVLGGLITGFHEDNTGAVTFGVLAAELYVRRADNDEIVRWLPVVIKHPAEAGMPVSVVDALNLCAAELVVMVLDSLAP
ncbi:membrane integrity-associated transporter subunit PqiC [bacterium]|nr:membrane integrity-associated transporter subunit PqiC [candidate division CSSED10-310 bacterium]